MKQILSAVVVMLLLLVGRVSSQTQDVTIVAPTSEAADGLDLPAVAELFKAAKDLEAFEKALNDPDVGVNNLDLDDNGEVDYIRVVEEASDDTHVIILQVPLAENEFQDVATIEVEKADDEQYNLQVHGSEVIYGVDYYVAPVHVHVHTWPIITWIYAPLYRPYRSVFYFGYRPHWWRPWHPVTVGVYRTRVVNVNVHTNFTVAKTSRVTTVHRVSYQPASSTLVKKQTRVTHSDGDVTRSGHLSRTTTNAGGKTTTVHKAGKQTVDKDTGEKTTVKAGKKEVTNLNTGKQTTVKGAKKTTKTDSGKKTTTVKAKKTRKN
ncbi:MAG TPA: hypothetical protein VGA99_11930 [bacterium]